MTVSTISMSYIFLGIFIFSASLSCYYKMLYIKTTPGNDSRHKIVGRMKDPITWRKQNNLLHYIFLIWSIISISIYIVIKFIFAPRVISIIYLIVYLLILLLSLLISKPSIK